MMSSFVRSRVVRPRIAAEHFSSSLMIWFNVLVTITFTLSSAAKSTNDWLPILKQDIDLDDYEYVDMSGEDSASYQSFSEETADMNTWRRFLKHSSSKISTTIPESAIRRAMLPLATPAPPIPPDVDNIDTIRKNLEGKSLEDTVFSNNTHFKMAVSFMSAATDVINQPTKDLQKAICLMDCQIAAASQIVSVFRGKDVAKAEEERLEREWNNMTEIERQFIEAVTAENSTRRSPKPITSTFQLFSDWCSKNCESIKKAHGKKHHKKGKHATKTTPAPDELDYQSEEDTDTNQRRAEDHPENGKAVAPTSATVPYTMQIPILHVMASIFGEQTLSSLSGPTLCLCGSQTEKICFCQSGKTSPPLITMTPSFS